MQYLKTVRNIQQGKFNIPCAVVVLQVQSKLRQKLSNSRWGNNNSITIIGSDKMICTFSPAFLLLLLIVFCCIIEFVLIRYWRYFYQLCTVRKIKKYKMGVLKTFKKSTQFNRKLLWLQISVFLFNLGKQFNFNVQKWRQTNLSQIWSNLSFSLIMFILNLSNNK